MKLAELNHFKSPQDEGNAATVSGQSQNQRGGMQFIRLADLVVNIDYIVTVKFGTYSVYTNREIRDIPIVTIWLELPLGFLDNLNGEHGQGNRLEELEFEGDLALEIWSYFVQLEAVTTLAE